MLGQLYGEFKFADKIFAAIGAKTYNTPYINANDVRMTPNTFEGATVYGTLGWRPGRALLSLWRRLHRQDQAEERRRIRPDVGSRRRHGRGPWRPQSSGGNYIAGDFSIGAADY